MRDPLCDECGGNARLVPDGFGYKWKCVCGAWAKADPESKEPLSGLAKTGLHQKRDRLQETLEKSEMTSDELRLEMGLKPWAFRIERFTHKQCEDAFAILQKRTPEKKSFLERLLS